MEIGLDTGYGGPVYRRLVDHFKREVALGRLRVGEKLPTVRELAGRLVVNPNTVAKAYRVLEAEGVIATRPGAGAFVAERGSRLSEEVQREIVAGHFERGVVEGITMGQEAEVLRGWFEEVMGEFGGGEKR